MKTVQIDEEQLVGMSVSGDTLDGNEIVTINVVEGQEDEVTQQVGLERHFLKTDLDS